MAETEKPAGEIATAASGDLFFLAFLIAALVVFSTGAAPQKSQGVLSPLKVGQSVALQLMDVDVQMSHTVVEVGQDYVVLKDIAEVAETRIPIYAVKAVVLVKTKLR